LHDATYDYRLLEADYNDLVLRIDGATAELARRHADKTAATAGVAAVAAMETVFDYLASKEAELARVLADYRSKARTKLRRVNGLGGAAPAAQHRARQRALQNAMGHVDGLQRTMDAERALRARYASAIGGTMTALTLTHEAGADEDGGSEDDVEGDGEDREDEDEDEDDEDGRAGDSDEEMGEGGSGEEYGDEDEGGEEEAGGGGGGAAAPRAGPGAGAGGAPAEGGGAGRAGADPDAPDGVLLSPRSPTFSHGRGGKVKPLPPGAPAPGPVADAGGGAPFGVPAPTPPPRGSAFGAPPALPHGPLVGGSPIGLSRLAVPQRAGGPFFPKPPSAVDLSGGLPGGDSAANLLALPRDPHHDLGAGLEMGGEMDLGA
jgi:hypothetical protein